MKEALYILLLGLFYPLMAHASQPRFDHFDMSNGLSQNNIFSLLVDETGYIWAGTLDGLNRYNGKSFEVFRPQDRNKNTLSGGIITALCQGSNRNIWIISRNGGLNRFNNSRQRFESIADSLLPGINPKGISEICFSNNQLWVQNQGHIGVYQPDSKTFDLTFFSDVPNGIRCFSDSSILVYGAFGIKELRYTHGEFSSRLISSRSVIQMSKDDKIIAATQDGIIEWDDTFETSHILLSNKKAQEEKINLSRIRAMIRIHNEVWIAGNLPLIRLIDTDKKIKIERFSYQREKRFSLKGYAFTNLQKDKAGNIWIGTEKHGLNLYDREKNRFSHLDLVFEDLSNRDMDPLRAICLTRDQNLWVGFDQRGVGLIDKDGNQKIYLQCFKPDNTSYALGGVRYIFEDSNGDIWLSELRNLCMYNREKDRIETVDCKFDWVWPYRSYVVREFEKGQLTICGGNNLGIVNLSTGNLTLLPSSKKGIGIHGNVRDMIYDRYQNLYLAMDNAAILKIDYPDLNYSYITPQDHGLSDSKVYALESRNDSLWIATNTGINLFNITQNKVTDIFYESDGLSNNVVYSIHLQDNYLWYSSNRGFGRLNIDNHQFETFLPDDYFMDDAYFFDKSGKIYYGGYTGIVSFHPNQLNFVPKTYVPHVESFYLLNQKLMPGDSIDSHVILSRAISNGDTLRLSYLQNSFSMTLNAFPIKASGSHILRYRLLNLHDDWISGNPVNPIATYNKISPGNYVFQTEVKTGREHWSAPFELHIRIVPPVWQRIWFRFIILLLIAFLMALAYQYRVRQIRRRNELLKKTVAEQTAELRHQNEQIKTISDKLHKADQSKLRFFTNISHEFRTPLTLILGQIELMKNAGETKTIKGIKNSALHLLRLVNQLIDFRKMELGQSKLVVEEFDLVQFIDPVVRSFQILAQKKQIDLLFRYSEDRVMVWLDKDKLEKILYNLLSNAIKYTPERHSVFVFVSMKGNHICIEVSDTGIGIAPLELKHIFDRFFRSDGSASNTGGHGIGLTLAKGLTELQKGSITVKSEPNKGTSFTLMFKKGRQHFKTEDLGIQTTDTLQINEPIFAIKHSLVTPGAEILVVEDNDELSGFLQTMLDDQFKLIVANNGAEGLEKLKNHLPDLIISDIMMPIMDGMTFCSKVKGNVETAHIPFILLSAKSDVETRIKGFEMGVDAYVEKPFTPQLLYARINALLGSREHLRQMLFTPSTAQASDGATLSKQDKQFWEKINILINASYSKPEFNTEQLATDLAMSRTTLHRKFKGLTGITPGEHIRKVRLKKACKHLENSSLTIAQIAEEVGFQSIAHFRKAFKDLYGKTPREYRNS